MTEPTPEERRREIAETFADGMEIFETRKAERDAKSSAEREAKEKEERDAEPKPKSFSDRVGSFLGI